MPKTCRACALFLILAQSVFGQAGSSRNELFGEFSYDKSVFQPSVYSLAASGYGKMSEEEFGGLSPDEKARAEAAANMLEEARFVFSGMLYGFQFEYQPYDAKRQVSEQFNLTPLAQLAVGDSRLKILKVSQKNNVFTALCRLVLTDKELERRQERNFMAMQYSQGLGRGKSLNNITGRHEAIADSMREAVRAYARKKRRNKPLRVWGQIFLKEAPITAFNRGAFEAKSKTLLKIDGIEDYFIP